MISALALLLAPLPLAPPPQDGINCWAAYAPQMPGSTRGGIAGEARIAVVTAARAALTEQPVAAKPGARPYVVRGDEVVIGAAQGGFVPAIHPKSGISGCLPLSALRVLLLPPRAALDRLARQLVTDKQALDEEPRHRHSRQHARDQGGRFRPARREGQL